MESAEFERAMVEVLTALIEERGLKHDPTANKAWPYKKAAGRTWQAIRSPTTGQKLTIRDAHALADALGISLAQVCTLAENKKIQDSIASLLVAKANHKIENSMV